MIFKLMPVLIIPLLHQVRLLETFDLYFCITFLFHSPLLLTLFSIYSVTLTFSTSSCLSALLVFLIRNQSLALINMSNFFFFFSICTPRFFGKALVILFSFDLFTLNMFHQSIFAVWPEMFGILFFSCCSAPPPQTRSGSICRRWGCSTSVSLSMSSATARWCCRISVRPRHPLRALCSSAPLTAWLVSAWSVSHSCKQTHCCRSMPHFIQY